MQGSAASRKSWRIARFRGVDLLIHPSLVFLFLYMVFLTVIRFNDMAAQADIDPSLISGQPALWGVIFGLALFISIALHEFGHVWVAQLQGVKARSVTLMMLGGISSMESIPERPYSEFKLAVFGPIVSLVLGGALLLSRRLTGSPDALFFLAWIGWVNVTLGIFNLLPAFPLDGGRAMRSALAPSRGRLRATQIAVRISKVLAWAIGIFGLIGFNVLLMAIAFFVYISSEAELTAMVTGQLIRGMRVRDIVTRTPTLHEYEPLSIAVDQMQHARQLILPVDTVGGSPALARFSQIRQVPRSYWETTRVRDVLEPAARVLEADEDISEALTDLAEQPGQTLPVREDGEIVGVLRYADLTDLLQIRSITQPPPEEDERRAA